MSFFRIKHIFIIFASVFFLASCSNLDVQTLNQRANELLNAGNIDGAIARLESINDLNPNFPQTHYNLGIAYYKKGDYEKSIKSLNKAVELNKNLADAHYSLGVVYEEMALSEIKKQEENKTNNPATILEDYKKSQESFIQYLKIANNAPDAENIKAKTEELNGYITKYESLLSKESVSNMPAQQY